MTLDNWHNRGYGAVLVLFHSDGKLVRAYKLGDLCPKRELDSLPRSESSILWHKGPTYISDERKVFYMGLGDREAPDYRDLTLNLIDGSVTLCARPPLISQRDIRCWVPGQAAEN